MALPLLACGDDPPPKPPDPPPHVIDALNVPAEFPTIQDAIDASEAGDTILVADGTYSGPGNYNIDFSAQTSPFPHNLVVMSENGPEHTIIDVLGSPAEPRRGFVFHSQEDSTSVLQGFTIQNGWMASAQVAGSEDRDDAARHDLSGGGIIVRFLNAAPIIRNCIIRNCYSEYSGGGFEAEVGAAPIVEDCVFVGNRSANVGGGMSFEFGATATLRRCLITGNASGLAGGGAAVSAPTRFESCTISGNYAGLAGGGFGVGTGGGIDVHFPGSVTLERVIVWGNCAADSGRNVFVEEKGDAHAAFTCSLVDTTGGPRPEQTTLTSCVFTDPLFCDPRPCEEAPTTDGAYAPSPRSPARPANNACQVLMGAVSSPCP